MTPSEVFSVNETKQLFRNLAIKSMYFAELSSLVGIRTRLVYGHRFVWSLAAATLVALFLVLAAPVRETVWADEPEFTITVSNVDFETATVSFEVTGLPDSIDNTNWIANIKLTTPEDASAGSYSAGPGRKINGEHLGDGFNPRPTFNGSSITVDDVNLARLVPNSDYTLTVTIYEYYVDEREKEHWIRRGSDSTAFTTKGGCLQDEPDYDPDTDNALKPQNKFQPNWYSGSTGRTRSETSIEMTVSVNGTYAGINSGRCVYYTYTPSGGATVGPLSAYVHGAATSRKAVILVTGLKPGTLYNFGFDFHPEMLGLTQGNQQWTLGPPLAVKSLTIDNITQTDADATVEIDNAAGDQETVYLRYYRTVDADDSNRVETELTDTTTTGPVEFDLTSLVSNTSYMVEASLRSDYFPSGQSEVATFVTKPSKPTGLTLTPGDGQLMVSWTKPAGGNAIDEYKVQWKESSVSGWASPSEATDAELDLEHTIENLTNATEYTVQVWAINEEGQAVSDEETGTPAGPPDVPDSLTITPGVQKLSAAWAAPTGDGGDGGDAITKYELQWREASDSDWSSKSTFTTADANTLTKEITQHSSSLLKHSTTYSVRVRAVNSILRDDEEDYSWLTGTATTLPDKPASLAVKSGNQQLTLSWEEPADLGSVAITDYVVQYRKTSENSWTTSSTTNQGSTDSLTNVTTYSNTIPGLDYSTEYDLRVRADNGVTLQDEDDYNWAEDGGPTIPDSPGNLLVTPGDEKLNLSWEAPPTTSGISIVGFIVQYRKTADTNWTSLNPLGASSLETTIGSLDNNVPYSVRVRAVNTAVLDDEDDYNWAAGSGTPVPDPSISTVTVDANSITQTGATVIVTLDRTNGVTQKVYVQYQTVPNGGWSTPPETEDTDATSVEIALDALEGNTEYEVQAWLETDQNTRVKSDSFTTKPVPPGVPTNSEFTPGNTIIELEWDPPTDNGGEAVTHYVIEWVEFDGHNWETSTLSSATTTDEEYEITGLTNGTKYAIRLRADNGTSLPAGKSYNWVFGSATPRTIPAAPTVTVTPDNGKLHVRWNEPDDGGDEITGYVVQYSEDGSTWTTHGQPGSNTFETTIPGLDNGTEYFVRVRAKNDVVLNDPEDYNWGSGSGTPLTIPAAPALTVTPGDTVLVVTWDEPDDGGNAITGHVVQYKKNTDDTWTTSNETIDAETDSQTNITSYETTIINLENGITYDVRVRSVNVSRARQREGLCLGRRLRQTQNCSGCANRRRDGRECAACGELEQARRWRRRHNRVRRAVHEGLGIGLDRPFDAGAERHDDDYHRSRQWRYVHGACQSRQLRRAR